MPTENPLEAKMAEILDRFGIPYERNKPIDDERSGGRNLDFYIPPLHLFIEVKAFPCERMHRQIDGMTNVIEIIGEDGVAGFGMLLRYVRLTK